MTMRRAGLRQDVYEAPASSAFPQARFMFIDILRLVAATAVMVQHVFEDSPIAAVREVAVLSPGVFGVVLFFLVSGFVMPLSVRHRLVLKKFAARRIFRIYPGLLAGIALFAGLQLILGGADAPVRHMQIPDWIANVLLIQDFVGARTFLGVTWTLILEMFWYAIFAVMWLAKGRRSGNVLALAAPAILIVLMAASYLSGHRLPLGRVGMIYAAIIGMRAFQRFDGQISAARLAVDTVVFVLVMTASNILAFGYFKHPNITLNASLWPWLLATAVFMGTQWAPVRDSFLMRSRKLATLGAISLSIYLLHPSAILICKHIQYEGLRIPAIFGLSLTLATLFYRLIERPGIALGRRIEALFN